MSSIDTLDSLASQLVTNLKQLNYTHFLPIQQKTVDTILKTNHNVLIESPCGSGKTLACLLPALFNLQSNPFTIFITPSTELAKQHANYTKKLTASTNSIISSNSEILAPTSSISLLYQSSTPTNPHFIFATPQTFLLALLTHKNSSKIAKTTLAFPTTLIIDEADDTLHSSLIVQICRLLQIRPPTALDFMQKQHIPKLIFASATLSSKFELLNSTRAAPGVQIFSQIEPNSKQFLAGIQQDEIVGLILKNAMPLPGIVVFDNIEQVKVVFSRLISFSMIQRLKFAIICVIKGINKNFDNAVIRGSLPENIPQKCLVLCLSENVRGIDLNFQSSISLVQDVEKAKHGAGRAGRGEKGGIRIYCVEEANKEKFGAIGAKEGTWDEINEEMVSLSRNLGQVVMKREVEEPDEQIEFEDLVFDNEDSKN